MDSQLHFPVDLHFCDFWCVIFRPDPGGAFEHNSGNSNSNNNNNNNTAAAATTTTTTTTTTTDTTDTTTTTTNNNNSNSNYNNMINNINNNNNDNNNISLSLLLLLSIPTSSGSCEAEPAPSSGSRAFSAACKRGGRVLLTETPLPRIARQRIACLSSREKARKARIEKCELDEGFQPYHPPFSAAWKSRSRAAAFASRRRTGSLAVSWGAQISKNDNNNNAKTNTTNNNDDNNNSNTNNTNNDNTQ